MEAYGMGALDLIRAEGRAEGRVEGEAGVLLKVLAARGMTVDDAQRQRILTTRDSAALERWVLRALNATRIDDVLD